RLSVRSSWTSNCAITPPPSRGWVDGGRTFVGYFSITHPRGRKLAYLFVGGRGEQSAISTQQVGKTKLDGLLWLIFDLVSAAVWLNAEC
ncbi:MAG TPA: hypothetical protein VFU50_10495, partial [Terriglobales bacterium]|nr:hypothetical protein [Terriglobales bacterium]